MCSLFNAHGELDYLFQPEAVSSVDNKLYMQKKI